MITPKSSIANVMSKLIRNTQRQKRRSREEVTILRISESTNLWLSVGSCLKQQVLVNRYHVVAARTQDAPSLLFKSHNILLNAIRCVKNALVVNAQC